MLTANLLRKLPDYCTGRKRQNLFKTAAFLLILFCLSGTTIAWSSPSASSGSESTPPLSSESVPAPARLLVSSIVADQVNYGQTLNIWMKVTNAGDMPARNVHLYCRANPGGFFIMQVADQPFVALDADNVDVCLDNVSPVDQKEINLFLQVPMRGQIEGEWSHNFHFDFSIANDGTPESHAGTITLSTRQGKILVQKSGFSE